MRIDLLKALQEYPKYKLVFLAWVEGPDEIMSSVQYKFDLGYVSIDHHKSTIFVTVNEER